MNILEEIVKKLLWLVNILKNIRRNSVADEYFGRDCEETTLAGKYFEEYFWNRVPS